MKAPLLCEEAQDVWTEKSSLLLIPTAKPGLRRPINRVNMASHLGRLRLSSHWCSVLSGALPTRLCPWWRWRKDSLDVFRAWGGARAGVQKPKCLETFSIVPSAWPWGWRFPFRTSVEWSLDIYGAGSHLKESVIKCPHFTDGEREVKKIIHVIELLTYYKTHPIIKSYH